MDVISTSSLLRSKLAQHKRVAFVPTMGNLHDGHMELVKIAQKHANCVVVSIFVNPLQFGPNEDFAQYPRTLDDDCKKLEQAGVAYVFTPSVQEMYPAFDDQNINQQISIDLSSIADDLCGASRPGHFNGVATIVTKLFHLVSPDVAVFGKKDFQQLLIIRKLVKQLNFPIEIITCETKRNKNGLALSSRNNNFNSIQQVKAAELHTTLAEICTEIKLGNQDFPDLAENAHKTLSKKGWDVDYIAIRSAITLEPALKTHEQLVVLGAATLITTRLIDNIEISQHAK